MDTHRLPPTTEDILEQCPRFRILLVGKSGVGKSSLINHAFSVKIATVSHQDHGMCDINTPIISPQNQRFVLHDSQGFEPGETGNLNKVKDFIESRSGQGVALKDRVHAVWLCIQVPFAGGRVFETGDEEFLKFAERKELPIVVVFTKFDKLVTLMEENLTEEEIGDMSDKEIDTYCATKADVEFGKLCVDPFKHIMPRYAKTSVEKPYRSTFTYLINLTQECVEKYVRIVSAMAQRASAQVKIEASIQVGMQQYWQGLASSTSFLNQTLAQCLFVIHDDITSCWNFNDSDNLLNSDDFQRKIKTLVQLVTPDLEKQKSWFDGLENLQTLMGVVLGGALSSAAAPAFATIRLSVMFIKWIAHIYQQTPEVLRCLMGYIVNLTLVMNRLFLDTLNVEPPRRLTVEQIDTALERHKISDAAKVHRQIREYANKATFPQILQSNNAQARVIELIRKHVDEMK